MITLLRNKRKIYVCKLERQGSIAKYNEPIKLYENYNAAKESKSDTELATIGLEIYNFVRIRTSLDHEKYYHIGDRVYINVEPPKVHDELCKDADYEVYREPVVTLNNVEILLKRRSGR